MDVLLGAQPGAAHAIVAQAANVPVADHSFVMAAPAVVIAHRPDIRVAERTLAAATAQQGVAVSKLFPDISISGFLGFLSTDSGTLLNAASKSWDYTGNVVWPILNWGKLSAGIDIAKAEKKEALLQYQKSILSALSDVERSYTGLYAGTAAPRGAGQGGGRQPPCGRYFAAALQGGAFLLHRRAGRQAHALQFAECVGYFKRADFA